MALHVAIKLRIRPEGSRQEWSQRIGGRAADELFSAKNWGSALILSSVPLAIVGLFVSDYLGESLRAVVAALVFLLLILFALVWIVKSIRAMSMAQEFLQRGEVVLPPVSRRALRTLRSFDAWIDEARRDHIG